MWEIIFVKSCTIWFLTVEIYQTFNITAFFHFGGLCGAVGRLIVERGFSCSMNLVRWTEGAANHSLNLLSESLVYQTIYKGIDGWIEQDHYCSNGPSNIARAVGGAVIAQEEDNCVSQPADWEDDTDGYNHQSDTLSYLYHSLKV